MISLKPLLTLLVIAAVTALSCPAQAVTCTVNGTLTLESQDSYYCDPDVLGGSACNGWKAVDLDDIAVPLRYMAVGVYTQAGSYLTQTTTNINGFYSATFTLSGSQCAGQTVDMRLYFARAHESDVGLAAPRWRFWVTHLTSAPLPDGDLWARTELKSLTGPTSTYNKNWSRTGTWDTTRVANVFFTASEYLRVVTTWSSNLNASFTYGPLTGPILRIGIESDWDNGGWATSPYDVVWPWSWYALGAGLRHELGHVTHMYAHKLERNSTCESYWFNGLDQHFPRGCEYGPTAVSEGIASFFAVASITSVDTNTKAWFCNCIEGPEQSETPNWDVCSKKALGSDPDGDTDWFFSCLTDGTDTDGTDFWYLGDYRVSSTSNCNRLVWEKGCNCPEGTYDLEKDWNWCSEDYRDSEGWRNEVQISRYFWDFIDDNNESGLDDTYRTRSQFIADLEGMPCAGNLAGVDGSCEEQAIPLTRPLGSPLGACGFSPYPACTCEPENDGWTTPNGTGTRDSYNPWDFAELIPGDQSQERTLNCVQGAQD